jgi:cell division protein FtsB
VTGRQSTCWISLYLQETIRQQEWKIERLTKDNRALEASNCELRAQLEALKEENLQVRWWYSNMQLGSRQRVVASHVQRNGK